MLITKVWEFILLLEDESFKPCGGWLQHFRECYSILYRKVPGESTSQDNAGKAAWLDRHVQNTFEKYEEGDIYSDDETGLLYQMLHSGKRILKG